MVGTAAKPNVSDDDAAPEPRSLLKHAIAEEIRKRIINGQLHAGEQLSDKVLAAELNASRTPVREALLELQLDGLVEVLPQRGTYVFNASPADIVEICVARGIFEADAIRLAMQENPDRLISALGRLIAESAMAVERADVETFERLDTAFHETLVNMAGNRYLLESYSRISWKVRALRHQLPESQDRISQALIQHRRIVDLITIGNVDDAAKAIYNHVLNVQQQLVDKATAREADNAQTKGPRRRNKA